MRRTDSGTADDRPFWHQRGWQLSAAFLGLVLCSGAVTAVVGVSGDGTDDQPRAAAGPLVPGVADGQSRPAGCRTDDGDQRPPQQAPEDVTWRPLNGAKIPVSPSAGPVQESGPVLWCFAHTPMGAVMAANVIPRHMSGAEWQTVTEQQVVPGVDRDVFVARRSSMPVSSAQYTANTLAGFMLLSYAPETATVRLLIRQSPAVYGTADFTVAWDGGDWKLRPLSGGELHTPVTAVTANGGFVMWKV
ncbi:hypothetical protein AB0368_04885 [Actinoplanes sp. NPDC051475]|uniref:hypothetical protein n=1 Tax=Actinoplanes sp. NPDC051475 TaxID=3157225 RepID=UPI00344DF180